MAAFVAIAPSRADTTTARAWLDRDTMHLGETVTLNVEAQGKVDGQPDFSALAQDFDLLGTQSSQQFSIVNGSQHGEDRVGRRPRAQARRSHHDTGARARLGAHVADRADACSRNRRVRKASPATMSSSKSPPSRWRRTCSSRFATR